MRVIPDGAERSRIDQPADDVVVGRRADHYVEAIRAIKADESDARLQRDFFERAEHPAETPQ